MADKQSPQKIKALELGLEEQRRDYEALDSMYESARAKNYWMIALSIGLLGYLYAKNGTSSHLKDKLFIPKEAYGVIIYAYAALMFAYGLFLLGRALKSRQWETAYENKQDERKYDDYGNYLEYMRKRYLKCSETNGSSYADKQQALDMALWPLLNGGILLIVLKTFQGG